MFQQLIVYISHPPYHGYLNPMFWVNSLMACQHLMAIMACFGCQAMQWREKLLPRRGVSVFCKRLLVHGGFVWLIQAPIGTQAWVGSVICTNCVSFLGSNNREHAAIKVGTMLLCIDSGTKQLPNNSMGTCSNENGDVEVWTYLDKPWWMVSSCRLLVAIRPFWGVSRASKEVGTHRLGYLTTAIPRWLGDGGESMV